MLRRVTRHNPLRWEQEEYDLVADLFVPMLGLVTDCEVAWWAEERGVELTREQVAARQVAHSLAQMAAGSDAVMVELEATFAAYPSALRAVRSMAPEGYFVYDPVGIEAIAEAVLTHVDSSPQREGLTR